MSERKQILLIQPKFHIDSVVLLKFLHYFQPGRTCASCIHVLNCKSNNVGTITKCGLLMRYCNDGRCSMFRGPACDPTTTTTTTTTTPSPTTTTPSTTTTTTTPSTTSSTTTTTTTTPSTTSSTTSTTTAAPPTTTVEGSSTRVTDSPTDA